MRRFLLLGCLLALCLGGSAQNPAWSLPGNFIHYIGSSSFAFPPLPQPTTLCNQGTQPVFANYVYDGYDGQLADYSSNLMLNSNGEPEFFIVDGVIYDGEGNYIDEMLGATGLATGASETVIVPDPAHCDRYYIIAAAVDQSMFEKLPYVFLLDMSLPNQRSCEDCAHYGALVLQSCPGSSQLRYDLPVACVENSTIPDDPSPGKVSNCFIAASDLQQGSFYWVFISNPEGVFRFRIDASGFNYDNHFIPFGITNFNQAMVRSEMELVELPGGGFRLAVTYEPGTPAQNNGIWEYLYVVDLDANANAITSTEKRFPMYFYNPGGINKSAAIKGIEFSRYGDRIYVTHSTSPLNPDQMEYYDFSNPTVALVPFGIPASIDARFSGLELAANDKLILANQNGLFQLPNSTTATPASFSQMWAFSYPASYEGLPGYDFTKMYLLPDQIDGMDYAAHFVSSVVCCINSSVFDAGRYSAATGSWAPGQNPLVVTGPDIYISEELRVPAGVDLTITNMTLHFAPGARLVVENGTGAQQGGKLTLDKTTLTVDARCTGDQYWLGVEVWGNTNSSQGSLSNSSQGRLTLLPDSKIEHALVGVLLGQRKTVETPQDNCPPLVTVLPFVFDYARTGGIVRSTGAGFHNNQRGVWFLPYLASTGANNLSQFNTTEFYWDSPLNGNLGLQHHAHLNQVKGLRFIGCSFRNDVPTAFSYTQQGTGIYSYRAQFHVQPKCPVLVLPCTACPNETRSGFEGLRFGVRAYNPGAFTFSVIRSDFKDNQYGIYAQYTEQSQIRENVLEVRQAAYQTAGIALYYTPTFTLEENQIMGMGSTPGSNSYGIVVNNSDIANNDVYLNTFENLHIGGQSEYNNAVKITSTNYPGATNFNMSGLNWTCNDFRNGIDVADLTVVGGRIDYFQGHAIGHNSSTEATLGSARNRFSLHGESGSLEHDVRVSGNDVQELQYVGLNTAHYWADSYTPNWVLPLLSGYNGTPATVTTGMCPSRCEGDKGIKHQLREDLIKEVGELEDELENNRNLSQEEIDSLKARLRYKREQLDLLETQMVTDALLEYEELSGLESELNELGAGSIFGDLVTTFGQDLSQGSTEPDPTDPVEFLPLEEPGSPRKAIHATLSRQEPEMHIWPNPGRGHFELTVNDPVHETLDLLVVDLMGRTVHSRKISTRTSTELLLEQLNPGMYQVVIRHGNTTLVCRKLEILH